MQNNIVFTGLIRNPELLQKNLDVMRELRQNGVINSIYFSTWKKEVQDKQFAIKLFKRYDVNLIVSDEPEIESRGHVWHQMLSLYKPLELIEDDSFILKTRSDVLLSKGFLKSLLTAEDKYFETDKDLLIHDDILKTKIWIPYFEITKPFYISDEVFYGNKADVLKLINFDSSYDILYNLGVGVTHIRRFIHPFKEKYPILKEYLKIAKYCSGHFRNNRFDVLDYQLRNEIFLEYLAIYYLIIRKYFFVSSANFEGDVRFREEYLNSPNEIINAKLFLNNFVPNKTATKFGKHIFSYSEVWLNNIIEQRVKADDVYDRFFEILKRVNSMDFILRERGEKFEEFKHDLQRFYNSGENMVNSKFKNRLKSVYKRIFK